ncbi:thioesterase domain-containing protein, partial [Actinocorallia aurantiaca]|uniref:thioesterase domain-containing protein n=1 Tax=Actinocorallia aurantiaca TaxID=46204 RepID=UPI0031DB46CB
DGVARRGPDDAAASGERSSLGADAAATADAAAGGGLVLPRAAGREGAPGIAGVDGMVGAVRAEAGRVLGHAGPVAADAVFLELGFDSLLATELRGRLAAATGMDVPATAVFDHPTPEALGRWLASGGDRAEGSIGALYWQACADGRFTEALALVRAAAALRPAFDADGAGPARAVPLTRPSGPAPRVVCLPGFSSVSGPHEFARFAAALGTDYAVTAQAEPGYLTGEDLPATLAALVEAHVRAIGDGAPVVLAGRSASGMLAHAVAERLEDLGTPPAAVLLLDSYSPDVIGDRPWLEPTLTRAVAAKESGHALRDDTRLTAMGRYHELFTGWTPRPLASPEVLLRATAPYSPDVPGDWRAEWRPCRTVLDVPGTHFSILEEDSASTAQAAHAWIVQHLRL